MSQNIRRELLKGDAYRMFLVELFSHIEETRRFLSLPKHQVKSEDLLELRIKFHSIKGAAGFFGFDSIARLAAKLEKDFLQQDNVTLERQQLLESIDRLHRERENLPAPG